MRLSNGGFYLCLVPFAICLVLSMQCSSDNPATPEPAPTGDSVRATIGVAGGELHLENEAWVVIPPGALDSDKEITITKLDSPPGMPANFDLRGAAYAFKPHGLRFAADVEINVTYTQVIKNGDLSMVRLTDHLDSTWDTVNDAAFNEGVATCLANSFSVYSVASFSPLAEVFVSTSSQGSGAAGTQDDPLPTISAGIAAAVAAGDPYPPVKVAIGEYAEYVRFVDGVSIHGGFHPDTWEWSENSGVYSTIVHPDSAAIAEDITRATTITALDIQSGDAGEESASSIALRVVNCSDLLHFVHCRIEAGAGAVGIEGDSGVAGTNGHQGGHAGYGFNNYHWEGGLGGAGTYYGGTGGDGAWGVTGFAGFAGYGDFCGGLGGATWVDGGNGGWGNNGSNGSGGTNLGVADMYGWAPIQAGNGTNGAPGCGGGGGGGAGHVIYGGIGGGGGGGGGDGGHGGQGGWGGGSSIAVFLYESDPEFHYCEIRSGSGGRGGHGGYGGDRGLGGAGGISTGESWQTGGNGGLGGYGGFGGSGGGGAGGNSYCVYLLGNVCVNAYFFEMQFYPGDEGGYGNGGQAVHEYNPNDVGPQADDGDAGESAVYGP